MSIISKSMSLRPLTSIVLFDDNIAALMFDLLRWPLRYLDYRQYKYIVISKNQSFINNGFIIIS